MAVRIKIVFLLLIFVTLSLVSKSALSVDNECYQSFNVTPGLTIDAGVSTISCTAYEQSRQDIFTDSGFRTELEEVDKKLQRLEKTRGETIATLRKEQFDELRAEANQLIKVFEAVGSTLDPFDDCIRAVLAISKANIRKIILKTAECVDEVDEAIDDVGVAVDAVIDEDTAQILRESSLELLDRLKVSKQRLIRLKKEKESKHDKFFEMCVIVKNQCFAPSTELG